MHVALDTTTEIETPEHIRFRHRVAGPTRRIVAYLVDGILRVGIAFIVILLAGLGGLMGFDQISAASAGVIMLVLFAVEWGYFVLFEALMGGRSPGKAIMRLRVVSAEGHPLELTASMLRNLLRGADLLPMLGASVLGNLAIGSYALGVAVMWRDARFRRLGDLVAGTIVVVEERHVVDAPVYIHPPPSPAELAWFPERLPLSTADMDAIELLLRRLPSIGPARANELAEIVAPVYARRMSYFGPIRDASRFLAVMYHRARAQRSERRA